MKQYHYYSILKRDNKNISKFINERIDEFFYEWYNNLN